MRNITFDLSNNSIKSDDSGSNESIKIIFINFIVNESIVKLHRGAYFEKILLDSDSIIVSDVINVSPYFFCNEVKIKTDKNYTYTTKENSTGGSGEIIENIYIDNEDVINQLGIITSMLDGMEKEDKYIIDDVRYLCYGNRTNLYDILKKHFPDGFCEYTQMFQGSNFDNFELEMNSISYSDYELIFCKNMFTESTGNILKLNLKDNQKLFGESMFSSSNIDKLKINQDSLKIANGYYCFYNSKFSELPILNIDGCTNLSYFLRENTSIKEVNFIGRAQSDYLPTSKNEVENPPTFRFSKPVDLSYCFYGCSNLEKITGLDITNISDGYLNNTFYQCSKLTTLDFSGTENVQCDLNLSNIAMTRDGFMQMLETLPVLDHKQSIELGTRLGRLSSDDRAQFENKGYLLSGVTLG